MGLQSEHHISFLEQDGRHVIFWKCTCSQPLLNGHVVRLWHHRIYVVAVAQPLTAVPKLYNGITLWRIARLLLDRSWPYLAAIMTWWQQSCWCEKCGPMCIPGVVLASQWNSIQTIVLGNHSAFGNETLRWQRYLGTTWLGNRTLAYLALAFLHSL